MTTTDVLSYWQETAADALAEITTFNIAARYDNIKRAFYHKAKKDYAAAWLNETGELYRWLKEQY